MKLRLSVDTLEDLLLRIFRLSDDTLGDLFLRIFRLSGCTRRFVPQKLVGTLGELAPKSKRGSVDALGSVVIEECYYVM